MRLVVHDGEWVVGSLGDSDGIVPELGEGASKLRLDVVEMNGDEGVAILSLVFVEESQRVHHLVQDISPLSEQRKLAPSSDVNALHPSLFRKCQRWKRQQTESIYFGSNWADKVRARIIGASVSVLQEN